MNHLVSAKTIIDSKNNLCLVELRKQGVTYVVFVDGVEYYSSPNSTFAQQVFNAI